MLANLRRMWKKICEERENDAFKSKNPQLADLREERIGNDLKHH